MNPNSAFQCASLLLQVTEESLATFFADCGTVMDCRICGDPNSAMRFAFIEFMEIQGAQQVGLCHLPCCLCWPRQLGLPGFSALHSAGSNDYV